MLATNYERRVDSDPLYRHTAQRWRDHLKAYPNTDTATRRTCEELIDRYAQKESREETSWSPRHRKDAYTLPARP